MDLSIIMPFANEYPQAIFTIMSIWNELKHSNIRWELTAINNWCPQCANQELRRDTCIKCENKRIITRSERNMRIYGKEHEDICGDKIKAYSKTHPWLKYVEYKDKLSHWQAKNAGVAASTGNALFFIDAHCVIAPGTLRELFDEFGAEWMNTEHTTLHLPLTYMLERDGIALMYKLVAVPEKGWYHYSFTRVPKQSNTYPISFQVPCMSTCGMMMSRNLYDTLGGWPKELGIYGGGENFINFTLATLGKTIKIFPVAPLHHFAERRGYNYIYTDYRRNQIIATYLFGGEKLAEKFSQNAKLDPKTANRVLTDVLTTCKDHRDRIKSQQKMTIEEWLELQRNPDKTLMEIRNDDSEI